MDFPIHIETMSMGLPIVYFKESQLNFSKLSGYISVTEVCLNLSKQCRPRWNAALCCISSVSSLFAKVPTLGLILDVWYLVVSIPDLCTLTYFPAYKGLKHHQNYAADVFKFVTALTIQTRHFMLHTKYQGTRPCGFRPNISLWHWGHLWLQGHILNKIGRTLHDAICQISRL